MSDLEILRWVLGHPKVALSAACRAIRKAALDEAAARIVLLRIVAEMRRQRASGAN